MWSSTITKQIWVGKVNGYVALDTIISFDFVDCEDSDEEDSFNITAKDKLGDVHLIATDLTIEEANDKIQRILELGNK